MLRVCSGSSVGAKGLLMLKVYSRVKGLLLKVLYGSAVGLLKAAKGHYYFV